MVTGKVSVIIPVYNGERFVGAALESVLGQTHQEFEVVVVNDGSTDNSREVIVRYLGDSRVRYVEQSNSGIPATRNTAIRMATGEFIALLDQDDVWHATKLERQMAVLQLNPLIGLVHSDYLIQSKHGIIPASELSRRVPLNVDGWCFEKMFYRNRIGALTVMVRRSCVDKVGLFDEALNGTDDYELWLRICRRYPIAYVPEVLATYRVHGGNVSTDRLRMESGELRAIERVLEKHRELRGELGHLVRDRLFELNFDVGSYLMSRKADFALARRHFGRAIRIRPLEFRAYRRYLWCTLTSHQRRSLAWYWAKMKHVFGS